MQRIFIDEVMPSMVLADTVKDSSNTVILTKGTTLTEKYISILNERGIKRVPVEGRPINRKGSSMEGLDKEIDERFFAAGNNPVTLKIKDRIKELLS
jgi:hypothetical protein